MKSSRKKRNSCRTIGRCCKPEIGFFAIFLWNSWNNFWSSFYWIKMNSFFVGRLKLIVVVLLMSLTAMHSCFALCKKSIVVLSVAVTVRLLRVTPAVMVLIRNKYFASWLYKIHVQNNRKVIMKSFLYIFEEWVLTMYSHVQGLGGGFNKVKFEIKTLRQLSAGSQQKLWPIFKSLFSFYSSFLIV